MRANVKSTFVAIVIAGAALIGCGSDDKAKDTKLALLDSAGTHYGKTYSEWATVWWTWNMLLPTDGTRCPSPVGDPTGELCNVHQSGDVFFLAGTSGGNALRTKCPIPRGKALFFPVLNYISDNGGVPPDKLQTEEQLRGQVEGAVSTMREITLKLDGVGIDTKALRVTTTKFSYTLPPEPNAYTCAGVSGVTGLISPSFSGGYYAMVAPPAPGAHEIEFSGKLQEFSLHVVYQFRIE